jgi:HD-GYP domain-containing protein (c-di-GMP phosphodiesterase class II)
LIAKDLGQELRCSESELEALEWGGLLHDVGKIGIPDVILLKTGALTKEERMVMNAHPVKGEEILKPVEKLAPELPIIRHHHEWFNGSGYPDGVEALDIPLGARILTIADAYEAMTSSRPYRKVALSHEIAIAELEKYSGIQFDENIVPILIGLDREILDRKPEGPDDLPTMLNRPEAIETSTEGPATPATPAATAAADATSTASAQETQQEGNPPKRPLLASDDVS